MFLLTALMLLCGPFEDAELAWRAEREAEFKSEDSWLNLAGLYWLKEGANRFGTGEDMDIVLPKFSCVDHAGTFFLEDGTVRYEMERAQLATLNGEVANTGTLKAGPNAPILHHRNLRLYLIERGDRLGIRVRDLRAKAVQEFQGLVFYKPKKKFVIEGMFVAYDEPETMTISTVIDTEIEMKVPGKIFFSFDNRDYELTPFIGDEETGSLFIIFKDATSGKTTYSGGRFLETDPPQDGTVVLNFNRAYTPPCGFSPYATCPLPPADNWLTLAIEAGEKYEVFDTHPE